MLFKGHTEIKPEKEPPASPQPLSAMRVPNHGFLIRPTLHQQRDPHRVVRCSTSHLEQLEDENVHLHAVKHCICQFQVTVRLTYRG